MKSFKSLSLYWLLALSLLTAVFPTPVQAQVTEASLGYRLLAPNDSSAERVTVKDYRVIDGDTADFILDRTDEPSIKARFLLIDAPELSKQSPLSYAAKDRVTDLFNQAKTIQLEYEGPTKDRYGRDLVHVWVDDVLLQEVLVTEGYAIARYIEDYLPNSPYVQSVYQSQDYAKLQKLGVWSEGDIHYLEAAEYSQETASTTNNSQTTLTSTTAQTVFYAPQSGSKYHLDAHCRGLRNANSIAETTLEEAQAMGLELCGYED